jgi:hypothetical protein
VCCSPVFPSVLSLGSTSSAPSRPGLFAGFSATMKRSDVLHVAIAIETGCHAFLTFDKEQAQLAKAAGLKIKTDLAK